LPQQGTHTLQHTATHCNTLQHTATLCNTLQHSATGSIRGIPNATTGTKRHRLTSPSTCNKLQRTHCTTLHHTAPHRTTRQHTAPLCNTLHHPATHFNTLQQSKSVAYQVPLLGPLLGPKYIVSVVHQLATNCNTHTAPHCTTLHHTAPLCNTLQHPSTHCNRANQWHTKCHYWDQKASPH